MIAVADPVVVGINELSADRGTTQVLVGGVDDHLGVGDVVDRRDRTALDTDLFVEHLHDRREAVGRARRSRDDVIRGRVVEVVVAAHHDVQHARGLDRGGDDHLSDATVEVRLERFGALEDPAALEDHVDAAGLPRNGPGCVVLRHGDSLAVDGERVVIDADLTGVPAVHRVEFDEMRGGAYVGVWIVHVDELEIVAERPPVGQTAGDESTDPPEPVDAHTNGHGIDARQSVPRRGESEVNCWGWRR